MFSLLAFIKVSVNNFILASGFYLDFCLQSEKEIEKENEKDKEKDDNKEKEKENKEKGDK